MTVTDSVGQVSLVNREVYHHFRRDTCPLVKTFPFSVFTPFMLFMLLYTLFSFSVFMPFMLFVLLYTLFSFSVFMLFMLLRTFLAVGG